MILLGEKITKQGVVERIRNEIVPKYFNQGPLTGTDFDFMLDLFKNHESWDDLVGSDDVVITCETDIFYGKSYGFFIHTPDGRKVNLSYKTALGNKKDWVKACARQEINDQIMEFRNYRGKGVMHVDHYPTPFSKLWRNFCEMNPSADYSVERDNCHAKFTDRTTGEAWQSYHKKYAKLRLIPATENMKLGAHTCK